MTYHAPQLLTIGNAANLVLVGDSDDPRCVGDNISSGSYTPELW
jgi:hypothetical protein